MTSEESSEESSLGTDVDSEQSVSGSDSTGESFDRPSANAEQSQASSQQEGFGRSMNQPGGPGPQGDGNLRQFLRKQFAMQMENVIPEDLQSILDKVEARLESLRDSGEVEFTERVYGRIRLAARMLGAAAEGSFPLPWKSTASIAAGLTYLLNPGDFLPAILKGDEAVLDDALVIYLCYTVVEQDLTRFMRTHNLDPEEFGMKSLRTGL